MRTLKLIRTLLFLPVLMACSNKQDNMEQATFVEMKTSVGKIKLKLYHDTPLHHDNFLRLVEEGAYNGNLFHRVIKGFMVQTGNPILRAQGVEANTDTAKYDYTIPAEIKCPQYFHKRGALAAARMGDDVNPEKRSNGTQFYIVTGEVYTPGGLVDLQATMYMALVDSLVEQLRKPEVKNLYLLKKAGKTAEYMALQDSIRAEAQRIIAADPPKLLTAAQKSIYTTIGGCPHLDHEYTVFGEVVEGMDIIASIEKTPTRRERPLKDFYIESVKVVR